MNFTETREAVNFTSNGEQILNKTLLNVATTEAPAGANVVWNDTEVREIEFTVSAKDPLRTSVTMLGLRCIEGTCPLEGIEEVPLEAGQRLWSDVSNWGGTLPQEGDDVTIPSGWNMILDLEETPILSSLTVNGRLSFLQMADRNIHLQAHWIFVRAVELFIGSQDQPFENQAKITLHGD